MNRLPVASAIALQTLAFATAYAQWSPDYSISQRVGLYGPAQSGSSGLQISNAVLFKAPAFVAGNSNRFTGVNVDNGNNVWAWNGTTTNQIGLTAAANTGSAGYQFSSLLFQNDAGKVVGVARRFFEVQSDNGQNAWVWNGTTTNPIGLTAAANTGSAGRQVSEPRILNAAGQVSGHSQRFTGVNTDNGRDAWVWNGTTTVQIGFTGGVFTGSAGYQFSFVRFQNDDGRVVGYSNHYTGLNTVNGVGAWVWDGVSTTQIGLTGAPYTGSEGYHYILSQLYNDQGQVVGHSKRYTGVNTDNGQDAWVWNNVTTSQIGLTAAANTGSAGYRFSDPLYQNDAGRVAGYSNRYTGVNTNNGRDAWVWKGTTTLQVGLTGGAYKGRFGYQYSSPQFLNEIGQAVGISSRYTDINTGNGGDTWVWNGRTTTQIGLTGGAYTGSAGYQFSAPWFQNANGQVAGYSNRYLGANTFYGRNAWVWNGITTMQIGLTAPAHMGSAGYQYTYVALQNDAGQLAGYSNRYTGVNTSNGQDAWVWNGTSTMQIGLTGGANTGSAGYQSNTPQFQNRSGQMAGIARRYSGASTENGQDAWYFDSATGVSSPMIGSVRSSDNFAFSSITILTADGFVLGTYTYFSGGVGAGEPRAFAFRPDRGFTDLGNLVTGGLGASGWSTLQNPQISDALRTIVGYGLANGQSNAAGRSVFVMALNPNLCPADFNHDTVVDFFDYLDFVDAFTNGSASADFNNDSVIDFFDYLDFVDAFSAGC